MKHTAQSVVLSVFCIVTTIQADIPLFEHFPALQDKIAYVSLAALPTPVKHLTNLGAQHGMPQLYLKDDGLTGGTRANGNKLFGGNKVRKLEFLLADAQALDMHTVLTFGCVGSNHATATASCAQYLDLNCIVMLKPQPNSRVVRRNLLLMHRCEADMHCSPDTLTRSHDTIRVCLQHKDECGDFPYLIPTGGSCPLGILGYVNAALELKQQIDDGLLPEPDYLYIATGSYGTITGLLLGAHIAGLRTQIIPVSVEPGLWEKHVVKLFHATNKLLYDHDSSCPLFPCTEDDTRFVHDCCGPNYGVFTPEGMTAVHEMQEYEGITLEGTYSGKALAGLLHDVQEHQLHDKVILFWNTFCGDPFEEVTETIDYHELPETVHVFFEQDVQKLDQ